MRVADVGTERFSWNEFRSFVRWLPPVVESAFHRSRNPRSWWWTPAHDFAALQVFALQGANWQRAGGESSKPELITCPKEDWQLEAGNAADAADDGSAVPLEDIRAEMARRQGVFVAPVLDSVAAPKKKRVRLTVADVLQVKQLLAEGVPQGRIAVEFGVSPACISSICRGRTWSHVGVGE